MLYLKDGHRELDAVAFDLGNVLFDYDPSTFMSELGIPVALHKRLFAVLCGSPEWAEVDRGTLSFDELIEIASRKEPTLKREIRIYLKGWEPHFHAIPKNVESFYRIKESGVKTYVLSNISESTWKSFYRSNAFLSDFDGYVLSFEHHVNKPEPEIFKLLIDGFSLDPQRVIFMDDLEVNVKGAIAAGLPAIQLPRCADFAPLLEFE